MHFKYKTLNIKANNTLDINDIIAIETKVVSINSRGSDELIGSVLMAA